MQITREDLDNYQKIKAEIRAIEDQITRIYLSSPAPREVTGGRSSVTAPGNPTERKALEAEEKKRHLEERKQALELFQARIERFVDFDCDDAQVRAVIRCHYLNGRTWTQTSWICFRSTNKSTSQMVIKRYFRENNEDETETDNPA